MQSGRAPGGVIRFGVFEVNLASGELRKGGVRIKVQDLPFRFLAVLLERPGEVVTREQLRETLWPDGVYVDFDRSLNAAVSRIRDALGDSAETPRFVETLPRRGYRFVAPAEGFAGERQEAPARARRRRLAWVAAAAAAVLMIAGAAFWNFMPTAPEAALEPMRPVPLTSYPGHEGGGSFSPDGNQMAFPWNGEEQENYDIYVKVVGPGPPLRLTTHPDWDGTPAWSPDGRWIAFLRGIPEAREKMGLYLIPPLGGTERKLAGTRVPSTYLLGTCLAWSPDSTWLAVCDWAEDSPGRLSVFLLSVDSGERRRLTRPPEDSG